MDARVWVGKPPSDTLFCAICTDVFTQVRVCDARSARGVAACRDASL
jgi:hypothetical protein